jgi:hypothetical protein
LSQSGSRVNESSVSGTVAQWLNNSSANKNEDLGEILKELWPDCEDCPRDIV